MANHLWIIGTIAMDEWVPTTETLDMAKQKRFFNRNGERSVKKGTLQMLHGKRYLLRNTAK